MKFILAILLAALGANTWAASPATPFYALTNRTVTWVVAPAAGGSPATNVPTAQALVVPVGPNGFGVGIKSFGTNAALTTNTWITIESGILDSGGTFYPITNNNVTVVLLPRGVATNTYYTNFVMSTSATLGNVTAVRVKDIMQTNGLIGSSLAGNLFIERFWITTP